MADKQPQKSASSNVSRRQILSSVGGSAVVASGVAAGTRPDDTGFDAVEYEKVESKKEKKSAVKSAKQSTQYKTLRKFFTTEYSAQLRHQDSLVLRAVESDSGRVTHLVQVPLVNFGPKKYDDVDNAGAVFTVRSGNVKSAAASLRWFSDGKSDKIAEYEHYRLRNGEVESGEMTVTQDDMQQDDTDTVTTAASLECEACQAAYSAAAAVGCGITLAGICAAAAIPTGGGALTVCGIVVTALCGAAGSYDYFTGYSSYEICSGTATGGPAKDFLFCS